jgi:hypothetical protein
VGKHRKLSGELQQQLEEQWNYIAKVYGVAADDAEQVEQFKEDDWSDGFFEADMAKYYELESKLKAAV